MSKKSADLSETKRREAPAFLTHQDLNRRVRRGRADPERDSPGDSADDELRETSIGLDFGRDSSEEAEDQPLAERRLDVGDATDEPLSELEDEQFSSRPDPIEDLDSPTSTH